MKQKELEMFFVTLHRWIFLTCNIVSYSIRNVNVYANFYKSVMEKWSLNINIIYLLHSSNIIIYIYTIYFKYSLNCHTFKSFIRDKLKYINNLSLLHDILI